MINGKITKIAGEAVTLAFQDGQTLQIPISTLEGKATEGASVSLIVAVPGSEDAARQALAKHILNELIQN